MCCTIIPSGESIYNYEFIPYELVVVLVKQALIFDGDPPAIMNAQVPIARQTR